MPNTNNIKEGFTNWLLSLNIDKQVIDDDLVNLEAIGICYSMYINQPFTIWDITTSEQVDSILDAVKSNTESNSHFPVIISQESLLKLKDYLLFRENNDSVSLKDEENGFVTSTNPKTNQAKVRQPNWDEYEAAVLIDSYFRMKNEGIPKSDIVSYVSKTLRQRAKDQGKNIDSRFRNHDGISMRLSELDYIESNSKEGLSNTSVLFRQMLALYHDDYKAFAEILGNSLQKLNESQSLSLDEIGSPIIDFTSNEDVLQYVSAHEGKKLTGYFYEGEKIIDAYPRKNDNFTIYIHERMPIKPEHIQKYWLDNNPRYSETDKFKYRGYLTKHYIIQLIIDTYSVIPNTDIQSETKAEQTHDNIDAFHDVVVSVLKDHYPYGFKYDSIRELIRFRLFAEESQIELPDSDDLLTEIIKDAGILIEGKIFVQSDDFRSELQNTIDEIFQSGASAVYYESLFQIKNELMEQCHIVSAEQLKEYLIKLTKGYVFSKRFMTRGGKYTEKEIVSSEIIRVWGEKQTAAVNDLNVSLPYIPLDNIWRVISGNDLFAYVSEGVYLYVERLIYSDDDLNTIRNYVERICTMNGFASLSDIPLGSIEEENYEIPNFSIIQAIYKLALAKDYYLNGRILTKDTPNLDSIALLKHYLNQKDECSFEELENKEKELAGISSRQNVFQALYDRMIRVNKEKYVSDKHVDFDIEGIDKAISSFMSDGFCAIQDVTTFAMFPVCGQNWNLFLLESFCYRFSNKYSLRQIRFNDKNAGIIAEKKYNKSYIDILSIVLARSDIDLDVEKAGQYLFDTGYLAKRTYGRLEEAIENAKKLRKENK